MELLDRLAAPGPKRILALDGGGMRGIITLGFLARIEAVLRERHGRFRMSSAMACEVAAVCCPGCRSTPRINRLPPFAVSRNI